VPRSKTEIDRDCGGEPRYASKARIEADIKRERRLLRRHSSKDYRAWFKGRKRVASVEDLPYDEMLQRGEAVLLGGSQPAEFDLGRADKRARVRHVLSLLAPDYRQLLVERYMMGETLEDMAERRHIRYQSLQDKLETAEQEFLRVFTEHWGDKIPLSADDL